MTDVPQPGQVKPWGAAIATVLVCAVLGPPLGSLVFGAVLAMGPIVGSTAAIHADSNFAAMIFVGLFGIPFSYILGGLPAIVTGFALAAYSWVKGRPPLWFAVLTAAVVFGGAVAGGVVSDTDIIVPMVLVHAVPTLLCWLIVRTFWFEARS